MSPIHDVITIEDSPAQTHDLQSNSTKSKAISTFLERNKNLLFNLSDDSYDSDSHSHPTKTQNPIFETVDLSSSEPVAPECMADQISSQSIDSWQPSNCPNISSPSKQYDSDNSVFDLIDSPTQEPTISKNHDNNSHGSDREDLPAMEKFINSIKWAMSSSSPSISSYKVNASGDANNDTIRSISSPLFLPSSPMAPFNVIQSSDVTTLKRPTDGIDHSVPSTFHDSTEEIAKISRCDSSSPGSEKRSRKESDASSKVRTSTDLSAGQKKSDASKSKARKEKDFAREQAKLMKEKKAQEKQRQRQLESVNKIKVSKKETCTEMIVDIDSEFAKTVCGSHLQSILEPLGISVSTNWTSPTGNMIKWRRKVFAEYNEALGYFIPIPEEIRKEKFLLVVLNGIEFIEMVIDGHLFESVKRIKSLYHNMKIIYMIEGLSNVLRKLNAQNRRQFANKVHGALEGNMVMSSSRQRKTKDDTEVLTRVQGKFNPNIHPELIEDAMIGLQMSYNCLIFHTTTELDSAQWITILTQDISMIPYKNAKVNIHETICMEAGQVKAGIDNDDTFKSTLQRVKFVTPGLAAGIFNKYGSIHGMMTALKQSGPQAFLSIDGSQGPTGRTSSRKIGPVLSRNLHYIFSSTDPNTFIDQR
ncbi:hypothetical protein V1511DRAFT_497077 [Dipodascopsis uninucleata]